jgi:cytochrome c oxidase subunit 3
MLAVGMVVWLASELMFFGGLFAAYFTLRSLALVWPPEGVHLETLASTIATFVLLGSSATIAAAMRAFRQGDRRAWRTWTFVTIGLGAIFLANQVRELLSIDFGIRSNSYGSMYVLMTGFHGLHVLAGLVVLGLGLVVAQTGTESRREPVVESVGYYWHFVDAVWVALFLTLFVLR